MSKLHKLYEEITLRDTQDLAARALHLVASATGVLKRNLPAEEPTTPEFIDRINPIWADSAEEYIDKQTEKSVPWQTLPPDMIPADVIALADSVIDGYMPYPGGTHRFKAEMNWHLSPDNGASWPTAHWSEIPFRRLGNIGDIKNCWDINRHQFFPALALAYRATNDDKYIRALQTMIHSWCDQNTPETGIHYISNLEIGLRCISWIFMDDILKDAMDSDTRLRLYRNLHAQACHIAEYLPYTEKTGKNNHLIGDAASLAYIALKFPEWRQSSLWFEHGLDALWKTLDDQVLIDGMHFECSYGYHLFVAEFVTLLFAEMRRCKKAVPAKAHMLLEKMGQILLSAPQPDGRLPNINDNDGGYVIPLPLSTPARLQGILATLSVLYNRPDFKAASGGKFPLYAHLLLGEKGMGEHRIVPVYPDITPCVTLQKESGIAILRQNGDYLLLKNNPDPFPKSGHNHADLLSIILFLDGQPVLADAGTYRYNADEGFRNALRSTPAHNTLTVDLLHQAEPNRNFGWTSLVKPNGVHVEETPTCVIIDAGHDCYETIGLHHRRVVLWLKEREAFVVFDRMSGQDTHHFEQYWHLPPASTLTETNADPRAGTRSYKASSQDRDFAHISFFRENHHDRHEIQFGTGRTRTSYISDSYGEIRPATTLCHSWTSTLREDHASIRVTIFSKTPFDGIVADISRDIIDVDNIRVDFSTSPASIGS